MTALITIGPTQEPLDAMRLLTNRSTGELGTCLAVALAKKGHRVIALRGTGCTASKLPLAQNGVTVAPFTTTEDLDHEILRVSRHEQVDIVFHAAAVADFYLPGGGDGKLPSAQEITLTFFPTPKLLSSMRGRFPNARIIGWKFAAGGDHTSALSSATTQLKSCNSDACVLNGPSYGRGFGFMEKTGGFHHFEDREKLCAFLAGDLPLLDL